MSVYQKVQDMRVELQDAGLKKSGNNKFAGYTYFELEDFIPTVNRMMKDKGLCSRFEYAANGGGCELSIFESANPEQKLCFQVPMSTAALKGCHEVQNLGAVISYIRRYLWTLALEIVESDALDKTTGKDTPGSTTGGNPRAATTPAPASPTIPERIAGCSDLDALGRLWKSLTPQQQNENIGAKDVRKAALAAREKA